MKAPGSFATRRWRRNILGALFVMCVIGAASADAATMWFRGPYRIATQTAIDTIF
jgi:hypothetical protein